MFHQKEVMFVKVILRGKLDNVHKYLKNFSEEQTFNIQLDHIIHIEMNMNIFVYVTPTSSRECLTKLHSTTL